MLNWREQLYAARKPIKDSAETALTKILDDAQALAKPGDAAGMNGALEKLKAGDAIPADMAPSAGKLGELRTRWTAEIAALQAKADASKQERLEKAQAAAAGVRKELAPVLMQFHFSAALEQLDRAMQDPALAPAKEALAADKSDLEAVIALRQNAITAIHASGGKAITLNRGKTTISGKVKDEPSGKRINLELADGPEMSIGVDQLEARDINSFAPPVDGAGKAEDARRRGLLFFVTGDFAKAKSWFKTAQESGLGDVAKAYLDRIEILELGEVEVHARKDWADADVIFQAKRWDDALKAYTLFGQMYAKTKYGVQMAGELKARLDAIDAALHPTKPGLSAVYYRGKEFKDADKIMARVDANVNFDWSGQTPSPEVPHDDYCVRWTGLLKVPKAGHYTIATVADDGARTWIDGKQVSNDWSIHPAMRFFGEIDLTEGLHEFKVEFFQHGGGSVINLLWGLKDGFPEATIPASALFHDPRAK